MKILVTGGCGFIGSNFVRYILKKYPHYSIINLDKLTYAGNLNNLAGMEKTKRYKFVKGDICNQELVNELVKNVDMVVNFAAESHVDKSILNCDSFIKSNVLGTQTLLEACRLNGNKRFHHISTDEVYGHLPTKEGAFNEKTPYNPRNPYSASKAGSDHIVMAYFHTYGLPVTISNCSNNYGIYHFPEKLIPRIITDLLEGRRIPIYGDGTDIREWIHVIDHCSAVDLILKKGRLGETYCIGTGEELTNLEVAKKILKVMGRGEEWIQFMPQRKGHDIRYAIDSHKIRTELGWRPEKSFDKDIEAIIKWYEENRSWWVPLKRKMERHEELTVFD